MSSKNPESDKSVAAPKERGGVFLFALDLVGKLRGASILSITTLVIGLSYGRFPGDATVANNIAYVGLLMVFLEWSVKVYFQIKDKSQQA